MTYQIEGNTFSYLLDTVCFGVCTKEHLNIQNWVIFMKFYNFTRLGVLWFFEKNFVIYCPILMNEVSI